jgi:hypothetical protein
VLLFEKQLVQESHMGGFTARLRVRGVVFCFAEDARGFASFRVAGELLRHFCTEIAKRIF